VPRLGEPVDAEGEASTGLCRLYEAWGNRCRKGVVRWRNREAQCRLAHFLRVKNPLICDLLH